MTRSDAAPQPIAALTLAALGIVYGDIGTSPLYAAKEVFNPTHGIEFTAANVIGGVSTILWALMFVVTRDETAGVQLGNLFRITQDGAECLHRLPLVYSVKP